VIDLRERKVKIIKRKEEEMEQFKKVKIINGPVGWAIGKADGFLLIQIDTGLNAWRVIIKESQILGTPDLSKVPQYQGLKHLLGYLCCGTA